MLLFFVSIENLNDIPWFITNYILYLCVQVFSSYVINHFEVH